MSKKYKISKKRNDKVAASKSRCTKVAASKSRCTKVAASKSRCTKVAGKRINSSIESGGTKPFDISLMTGQSEQDSKKNK